MSAVGRVTRGTTRPLRRVDKPWARARGAAEVLEQWRTDGTWRNVTWSHRVEPHEASIGEMPSGLAPGVERALHQRGICELYSHQARAFELASKGKHVVVATPTASGKSLCYNLPILQALASDPTATALYLFPTKALSRDQEEALRGLMREADLNVGAITYDGDTPNDARRAARQRAGVLLTNPDMLHAAACCALRVSMGRRPRFCSRRRPLGIRASMRRASVASPWSSSTQAARPPGPGKSSSTTRLSSTRSSGCGRATSRPPFD